MGVPTDVMAQMGFGVADEGAQERMQGVASKLRGDRDLGQFFQLSGSANTRNLGKGMVDTSSKGITEIGKRRAQGLTRAAQKARDEEARRRNAYSEGRDTTQDELLAGKYETAQGRLDEQEGRAEEALAYQRTQEGQEMATSMQALETAEANRAEDERNKREALTLAHKRKMEAQAAKDVDALHREEVKARGASASAGLMGAREKTNFREAGMAARQIPEIMDMVRNAEDSFGAGKDFGSYMPDWTPNMIREGVKNVQNANLSDEQQKARNMVYNMSYQMINALAGAALSKNEEGRLEKFTPSPNDSAATIMNKLESLQKMADDNYVSFKGYTDYIAPDWMDETETETETVTEEVVATPGLSSDEQTEMEALEAELAGESAGATRANPRRYQSALPTEGLPISMMPPTTNTSVRGPRNRVPMAPLPQALPKTRTKIKGRGGG